MAGIALSGWDRLGWKHGWRENWIRFRDRKASVAALILAIAYLAIFLTGLLALLQTLGIFDPQPVSGSLQLMLMINAIFLSWRLFIRTGFVFRLYGFREALLSIPRTFAANIINIMAARKALLQYLATLSGLRVAWGKTRHFLPADCEISRLKSANTVHLNE
mgnify:CR=1 FL=1